jgi:two-component system, LytTR family, response regulator
MNTTLVEMKDVSNAPAAQCTVLVVDDEPLARRRIASRLQDHQEFEFAGECGSGTEAVEAIHRLQPDLVLLDIQMPEMDGIEVVRAVGPDRMPAVIFVTAFERFALQAFDVHAIDYLLKPFDDERLDRALQRARQQIQKSRIEDLSNKLYALLSEMHPATSAREYEVPPGPSSPYVDRLGIKVGGRVFPLKVQEIDWIEGAGVYVRIHAGGKSHLLRDTMSNLERSLDPSKFVRIHRSSIVNVDRIKELHPYFHGEYIVVLHNGTQIKLSRTHREKLSAILGRHG